MIEISSVSKSFGKKKAVDSLSLKLEDGKVYGLLGPNGAGKSTTLKMLVGILSPDKGEISIDGFSIEKDPLEAKRHLAFVPDSPDIFLGMKGREYLSFLASVYEIKPEVAKERILKYSELYHMKDSLEEPLLSYSHGMRQKIHLIGALLHDPKNWILDEPMTGLDPEAAFETKKLMKAQAEQGKCVLYSTHVLDVAEKICDEVAIIKEGKLIFFGSLSELQQKEEEKNRNLESLFLEITSK